jgi:hypothetical protein
MASEPETAYRRAGKEKIALKIPLNILSSGGLVICSAWEETPANQRHQPGMIGDYGLYFRLKANWNRLYWLPVGAGRKAAMMIPADGSAAPKLIDAV